MKNNRNLLWNPFTRIAGWQAFVVGIIVVAISAIIASYGNLLFDGAIDAHFGEIVTLTQSLIVSAIDVILVALVMFLAGIILSKNTRFIDILGTMTLARAPFLLLAIASPFVYQPSMDKILQNPMSVLTYPSFIIFGLLSLPIFIWFIALMYNALKVSTGAKGTKLIVGFVVGILMAEILSKLLIFFIQI